MTDTQFIELTDSIRVESLRMPSYIPDGESFKIAVGLEFQGKSYETEMLAYDHGNFMLVDKNTPFAKTDGLEALIAGRYPDDVERIFSGIAVNVDRFIAETSMSELDFQDEVFKFSVDTYVDELEIYSVAIEPKPGGGGFAGKAIVLFDQEHTIEFDASERALRSSFYVKEFVEPESSTLWEAIGGGKLAGPVFERFREKLNDYVDRNFSDLTNTAYVAFEVDGRERLQDADIHKIAHLLAPEQNHHTTALMKALSDFNANTPSVDGIVKKDGVWAVSGDKHRIQIRDEIYSVTGNLATPFREQRRAYSGLSFGERG
ncbi:hypothetical protein [Salinicola rhizosphaerae]|uniref:DUF4868 domain-containing protein n=1 Tax=Salinicola rhizosphaerae TaxID=1443141 RepID=A0ABQ3DS93_9GAMM|nr:hypothetical protein [Salinicola rhizosphaerae]GHB13019.1 hypothetical protein GCM10009038_08850 [Salinicola rhizosphaerae]